MEKKAAPLLRAWLKRLRKAGVVMHVRHRWTGWDDRGALCFDTPHGPVSVHADATVLALGGASWPKLGSTGAWVDILAARGVGISPLKPANCGFNVDWSDLMVEKFAGTPVKSVGLHFGDHAVSGDFVITQHGIEGSAVYALSAPLRDGLERDGAARLIVDLTPDRSLDRVRQDLQKSRGSRSLSTHLKRTLRLDAVKIALLREVLDKKTFNDTNALSNAIKALSIPLTSPRPLAEAISTAGGVSLDGVDESGQLNALPGVYVSGEMLDWEAPTGGYLLTACFALGRKVGNDIGRKVCKPS